MSTTIHRSFQSALLALAMLFAPAALLADDHPPSPTVLDRLLETDGAQAVVAAVLVVDEAGVLTFSLADLLGDKNAELVALIPGNAAFEKLLGLDPGTLNGLSIDDVKNALPGLLPAGVGANEVAAILLKHVAQPPLANLITASEGALLRDGSVTVADGSVFPVGIGASGVQINYETTVIKANVRAKNGVIHFIDTVIVDDLL